MRSQYMVVFFALLAALASPHAWGQGGPQQATEPGEKATLVSAGTWSNTDINAAAASPPSKSLADQVWASERAFARSMADRDFEAFAQFVAGDAVFFSGKQIQRGKGEVLKAWARFFEGASAPFSWEPDQVEVLDSGHLALSTGPVHGPDGRVIARFNSIWRLDDEGKWRVVFDKGQPPDPEPK